MIELHFVSGPLAGMACAQDPNNLVEFGERLCKNVRKEVHPLGCWYTVSGHQFSLFIGDDTMTVIEAEHSPRYEVIGNLFVWTR